MSSIKPNSAVQSVVNELLADLHAKGGCEKIGLTCESFAVILCEVGSKHATAATSETEIRTFFLSLRVDELALARACAAGSNSAWEIFLTRFREKLYLSALRIAREDSAARELADTLYADLYGTNTRDGQRVSKLASYTGRGSLEGWLRTVLSQEYVNRYRRTKRLVSLDEESEEGVQFQAPDPEPVPAADQRLAQATDEALAVPSRRGPRGAERVLSGRPHPGRDCPHAGGARIDHQPQARQAGQVAAQADCRGPGAQWHVPPPGRRGPGSRRPRPAVGYSPEFGARIVPSRVL